MAARLLLDQPRARGDRGGPVRAEGAAGGAPLGTGCGREGLVPPGRERRLRGEILRRTPKPQAEVDPFATLQRRSLRTTRPERHPWKRSPTCCSLSDDELSALLAQLEDGEDAISRRRRVLHGRIDILRAERTERLKATGRGGQLRGARHRRRFERPLYAGTGDMPAEEDLDAAARPRRASTTTRRGRRSGSLEQEEDDISLNRRVMHAQIDIVRAERTKRSRGAAHMSTPGTSARSSAEANESHLLPGMRLSEPGGGDLLLALRRAARARERR